RRRRRFYPPNFFAVSSSIGYARLSPSAKTVASPPCALTASSLSPSTKEPRQAPSPELEIEFLHEKIDQLCEREVLKLTGAVRMLPARRRPSAWGARESDAEGGRPSYRVAIDLMA